MEDNQPNKMTYKIRAHPRYEGETDIGTVKRSDGKEKTEDGYQTKVDSSPVGIDRLTLRLRSNGW